jgi:hypothetical protein
MSVVAIGLERLLETDSGTPIRQVNGSRVAKRILEAAWLKKTAYRFGLWSWRTSLV